MSASVSIPTPLRQYAGGTKQVDAEGATVGEVLAEVVRQHPALRRHLFADTGELRGFVNVYLGPENVRDLDGERTGVASGAVLTIVPSIAGG